MFMKCSEKYSGKPTWCRKVLSFLDVQIKLVLCLIQYTKKKEKKQDVGGT